MNDNIEALMKPGMISLGGFLGENEKLDEVLKTDDETIKRLSVTHEQIASRIEYFIKITGSPSSEGKLVDGKYLVKGTELKGGEACPWGDALMMPHSYIDFVVRNQEIGEELHFSGGIVHLIREHQFYKGKQSPHRVDPEKAVRVLNIM